MALELGPCSVRFGDKDDEADLGKTEGGVVVTFSTGVADLLSDQHGTSPEDQVITGQGAVIVVPLANITLANLAIALNQSVKTIGDDSGIKGSNLVGTKLSGKAQSLLLKKYVDGAESTDSQDYLRFPKAAPTGNFDYSFSKDGQRVINVNFVAFPDEDGYLYYIGDETAATSVS